MSPSSRYLPWVVLILAGIYLASMMMPPNQPSGKMQLTEFSKLPVVDHGRVKPIDTLARNSLMAISSRQTFVDEAGDRQPAIKWLLDVMASPPQQGGPALKHKVFRIENDQVLGLLGLKPVEGLRYSLDEIAPKIDKLSEQASRAQKVPAGQRDVYDRKLIELAEKVQLYIQLTRQETPLVLPPQSAGDDWKDFAQVDDQAKRTAFEQLRALAAREKLDVANLTKEQQEKLLTQLHTEAEQALSDLSPAAPAWSAMLQDYQNGKVEPFNKAVADYRQYYQHVSEGDVQRAGFEAFFNHFEPFYQCSILYVVVFFLACGSFIGYTQPLNRAAFWLAVLTLIVHSWALIARMYIQGRPPVTNLYSSAVFIGWGMVVMGLILEAIYRNGLGNIVAAATGFLTLLIAHNLAAGGDTLEMMQAVLDTNFWLATHVTCVTTGYAATFLSGFLGILFVLRGLLTRTMNREALAEMGRMIYGIVCFATFFSFTGTVLGGIWADYSWGRFWGWDPKENGALLIVIWNALILHARWGGMVQQRGMAVLAILGNIVTAWSWFGVNMLGVGLHSYGFMSGAVFWLSAFVVSQLVLAGLGMLPMRQWKSFAALNPPKPPPKKTPQKPPRASLETVSS